MNCNMHLNINEVTSETVVCDNNGDIERLGVVEAWVNRLSQFTAASHSSRATINAYLVHPEI